MADSHDYPFQITHHAHQRTGKTGTGKELTQPIFSCYQNSCGFSVGGLSIFNAISPSVWSFRRVREGGRQPGRRPLQRKMSERGGVVDPGYALSVFLIRSD
jgi:hypothetical protein